MLPILGCQATVDLVVVCDFILYRVSACVYTLHKIVPVSTLSMWLSYDISMKCILWMSAWDAHCMVEMR